jgi:predicted ester cyclase
VVAAPPGAPHHRGMITTPAQSQTKDLILRSLQIMRDGTFEDFEEVVHPTALNREAASEPPASRGLGPRAFYATALWLRDAFADLRWDVHELVIEGDLAVAHMTMKGRHVRDLVQYDEDARVAQVFPPTGKEFATTQTHWFRVLDGQVVEHWANRDDLGTAMQLGWVPPTPRYMLRMALARRRARRREARL